MHEHEEKNGISSLKDKYAIAGVGHSPLGKVPELSDYGLQLTAVKAALDDAGLKKTDIDAVITHSHMLGAVRVHHQMLSERLGIDTAFGVSVSSGVPLPKVWPVLTAPNVLGASGCQVKSS